MPAYCAPCPVNRNATFGRSPARDRPSAAPTGSSPAAMRAESRSNVGRRVGDDRKPAQQVRAAGARGRRNLGERQRRIAGEDVGGPDAPGRAAPVVARGERDQNGGRDAGAGAGGRGASSRITCALVPLKPNELTPARRGARLAAMASASSAPRAADRAQAMRGFGCREVQVRRDRLVAAAPAPTLMRPAMPAAASRWPMLVLTEPIEQRPVGRAPVAEHRAERLDFDRDRRAACRCRAPRRSRCRAGCEPGVAERLAQHRLLGGTVRGGQAAAAPVLFTAEPRITARMRIAVRDARRDSRLSTITPQPSPRTKPSAAASNVLQRPSGASMPHLRERAPSRRATASTLTPPASARSHSPARRLWQARCTATSDDEQAVSTATLGPRRPRM